MWLKNRLAFAGYFKPFVGVGTTEIRVFCEMHCFFLYIEETEAMLAKLSGEKAVPSQVARSRITKSPLSELAPIDRTAANVMKQEDCR